MTMGPVQLLVVAFEHGEFKGEIRAELERLSNEGTIRVLDLVFIAKDEDGQARVAEIGEESASHPLLRLIEGEDAGGTEGELRDAADQIPPGTAAGMMLIEHRWVLPLRQAIERTGGQQLADGWITPEDLAGIGIGQATH